jgi:hypothetical protein
MEFLLISPRHLSTALRRNVEIVSHAGAEHHFNLDGGMSQLPNDKRTSCSRTHSDSIRKQAKHIQCQSNAPIHEPSHQSRRQHRKGDKDRPILECHPQPVFGHPLSFPSSFPFCDGLVRYSTCSVCSNCKCSSISVSFYVKVNIRIFPMPEGKKQTPTRAKFNIWYLAPWMI